jgi:hypothetical protein
MDNEMVAIVAIAIGGGCAFMGMGLRAFQTWVNRPRHDVLGAADTHRLEDLEFRIAELEERADFTERLLAEQKRRDLPAQ